MNYKITCDENIPYAEEAFSEFGKVETMPGREITADSLEETDILLVRSVTTVNSDLLSGTPVKFVGSATTGVDHVNMEYLEENSIGFAHTAGANSRSVAEYTIASALLAMKKMGKSPEEVVIGVVGVGNIGSEVVKLAGYFGFDCMFCDPPKKAKTGSNIYRNLYDVLAASDIVTLHVPLERSGEHPTAGMADDTFFNGMKAGASLINTSRGEVVDETAFLENRERISSLVLDVWRGEPDINTSLLESADIATPHIAGYSNRGKLRGTVFLHKSLSAFFFHSPEWDYTGIDLKKQRINTEPGDSLHDIIIKSVGVNEIDKEFRKGVKEAGTSEGVFDSIRSGCADKPEFVDCVFPEDDLSPESCEILERIRGGSDLGV